MNQDKEVQQAIENFDNELKDEIVYFEKKRKLKVYRTLGVFGGIFSISVLIGIAFLGEQAKSIWLSSFSHLFELLAALFFSLTSGTLTTIILSKTRSNIKNSTLKEFIKHTYLAKLNESPLNPQTSITKQ